MEQNLVSDEELLKRISDALQDSKEIKNTEEQLGHSSADEFQDTTDIINPQSKESTSDEKKNLELENQILASQLQAERKKSKDLQLKFQLIESSTKLLEKYNNQFEKIRHSIKEDNFSSNTLNELGEKYTEAMQKLRQKTVHTAVHGSISGRQDDADDGAAISSEPQTENDKQATKSKKRDASNIDLEELKQFEENLAIVKDKGGSNDAEAEKVFITKTEKKWFEDIGNLASRIRIPLDEKHQKFYEKDRKRFSNKIIMPQTEQVDKAESVPADFIAKTKETPVNLTSTELDGLRSYLLQLKELIARRETAWARTTERDYNQRVEITRFKNEVSHLRLLCEKRQKDIKERDQVIVAKDEEIKDLQKKIQSLKNAIIKLEKRDEQLKETLDGLTAEAPESTHFVQKSYNVMKRASFMNKGVVSTPKTKGTSLRRLSSGKEVRATKQSREKTARKIKSRSSNSNDDVKSKLKVSTAEKSLKVKPREETCNLQIRRKNSLERVDEKLQRIEEMLHSDVLGVNKKKAKVGEKKGAFSLLTTNEVDPNFQKFSFSNNKMRQEVLTAMAGLGNIGAHGGMPTPQKQPLFFDPRKGQGNAAILANALLSARNNNSIYHF